MEITTTEMVILIWCLLIFGLNVNWLYQYDKHHMQIVANDYTPIWLMFLMAIPWLIIVGLLSSVFSLVTGFIPIAIWSFIAGLFRHPTFSIISLILDLILVLSLFIFWIIKPQLARRFRKIILYSAIAVLLMTWITFLSSAL